MIHRPFIFDASLAWHGGNDRRSTLPCGSSQNQTFLWVDPFKLIEYTLEANPDADDDKNAPPQKLSLAFSTADVVILGWRLGLLADRLQENDLAAVRALPKRYADMDRHVPFVASIAVTSIDPGKDRNSPK